MLTHSKNIVLLASCTFWLGSAMAADAPKTSAAGKVTFIQGTAEVVRGGKSQPLAEQSQVFWGDTVRTGKARTKLEIRLADGSVVRLARNSTLVIEKAAFAGEQREFSAKMVGGKCYAVVAKLAGTGGSFELKTSSAVAGVRGTTFRIDAKRDRSTVVRVYSGAVAVSNAPIFTKAGKVPEKGVPEIPRQGVKPGGPGRVEVPGPQEVTRKQWEEIVAQAMQEIRVSADGKLSAATPFDPDKDAADEWVAWNKSRDAELQRAE